MKNYLFSLGIIGFGLLLGYLIQVLLQKNFKEFSIDINSLRKTFQKIAILIINPVTFIGAIWIVNLKDLKLIVLPIIGITALVMGGFVAFIFSKMQHMNRGQTGAYIVAGGFTNIGSIGGLICYIFLGEAGYALVSFYSLFELISYYGFGFPIAKSYSSEVSVMEHFRMRLKKLLVDPFMLAAIGSISIGFFLNISGLKRPEFYDGVNAFFIPTGSILLITSIGMAMKFRQIGKYIKEGVLIALIKFVIVPIVATTLAYLVGLGKIDQGLPLKTVLILSSMPVGFIALIPPTIYDLDVDLANAAWFVTNISLLFVIPCLHYLITLF